MRLTSNRKLFSGVVLAMGLLLLVTWFEWQHTTLLRSTTYLVSHTEKVSDSLDKVFTQVLDIETGQRGFALTGESTYLEPFHNAIEGLPAQQRMLAELILDSEQQENLTVLNRLIEQHVRRARSNVELRQKSGMEAARKDILTNQGKTAMDQLRVHLARMDLKQKRLLEQRIANAEQRATWTWLLMAGASVLSFTLLGGISIVTLRENRLRKAAQQGLERSLSEVQDLYHNAPCGYHSVDKEGVFIAINDTELRWFGYTREELVGKKKHRDLVSKETQAAYDKGFTFFTRTGEVKDLEFEIVRKDGTVMNVLLNATAIRDEGQVLK